MVHKTLTIIGEPFFRYEKTRTNQRKAWVLCRCICGNHKEVKLENFRIGKPQSCGCIRDERRRIYKHPVIQIWWSMKKRVYSTWHKRYKDYGGRGITICDEWKNSYENFYRWALANGWQKGLQIDRIDNDGNYEPSNCRWVTNKENCQNRRTTKANPKMVEEIRTLWSSGKHSQVEIGKMYGIVRPTISSIINRKSWA